MQNRRERGRQKEKEDERHEIECRRSAEAKRATFKSNETKKVKFIADNMERERGNKHVKSH